MCPEVPLVGAAGRGRLAAWRAGQRSARGAGPFVLMGLGRRLHPL